MNTNKRLETLASVMRHKASRRHALHGLGVSGLALALASRGTNANARQSAQERATPDATTPDVNRLDSLDDLTRDYIAQALWLDKWDEEQIPASDFEKIASAKNSNDAFGERMHARLQVLIDDPETFTPSHADRYAKMLEHVDTLNPLQVYAISNLLGPDNAKDFPALPSNKDFTFPERHAVDLDRQVGWYFVVGSCTGTNGNEYGVELMFFVTLSCLLTSPHSSISTRWKTKSPSSISRLRKPAGSTIGLSRS